VSTLISCVVATHDGERYLAAALDSVLAQEHRPLEVIVVDDGSSDASAEIAESYGEPVRVIRQANAGQGRARNAGIQAARGDYICFLDDDDLYRPGKLAAQLAVLEKHPEVELCLCQAENFWEPGFEAERARYLAYGKPLIATSHVGTVLARRGLFDRVGLMDASLDRADDIDWFLRVADLGVAVHVLPDVFYERRMHAASMTHTKPELEPYFTLIHERIADGRAKREGGATLGDG
jgi:glycosyltransferase involved in cell wall biosynthesis